MPEDTVTIRVWRSTLRKLKVAAGMHGTSMVALIDRLVTELLEKAGIVLPDDENDE